MSYHVFNRTLARWAKAAEIPISPVTPHLLRHSCATIRAENGMETVALQRYMGWKTSRRRSTTSTSPADTCSKPHAPRAPPFRWGMSRTRYER